jgi:hypothetical protein
MRASPRFAWGGVRAADGGVKLFAAVIHDPSVSSAVCLQPPRRRHLPSFAATTWTHLPEGGYRIANPRLDRPQSETVKPRTVSRAKYLQGVSAVSASDLPVTGLHSKTSFSSIPAFSAISATRFDCRRRRVADAVGSLETPALRHAHPPRAGDRRLRTIDGADMAVIFLPATSEVMPPNLSISQVVV